MLGLAGTAGLVPCRPAVPHVRGEVSSTVYEKILRAVMRLLEAALKSAGLTALVISCALLVYLGAVLLARLSAWVLFP